MPGENADGNPAPAPADTVADKGSILLNLPGGSPPPILDLESNPSENWKLWKQMWENYLIITGLDQKPDRYISALLLHCVGKDALRVYNGFTFDSEDDKHKPDIIIDKFDEYVLGATKEFFERFIFNRRNQESETFDQYYSALRNLEKSCGFCDCMREKLIMDRIILGIKNEKTREKLISQAKLDLQKTIDICRAMEAAGAQMKAMNLKSNDEIHAVKSYHGQRKHVAQGRQVSHQNKSHVYKKSESYAAKSQSRKVCYFCSQTHELKKEVCPAWGKTCDVCKGKNHFKNSVKCPKSKKHVHAIHENDDSDSSYESISTVTTAEICKVNESTRVRVIYNKDLVITPDPSKDS